MQHLANHITTSDAASTVDVGGLLVVIIGTVLLVTVLRLVRAVLAVITTLVASAAALSSIMVVVAFMGVLFVASLGLDATSLLG